MQTTPEIQALLDELYDRSAIVEELDGPQIEAWVSGLFAVFDDEVTAGLFVGYCASKQTSVGALLCAAIAELANQIDEVAASAARDAAQPDLLPPTAAQIGSSELTGAWNVRAPFGRSIVLGFDNPIEISHSESGQDLAGDEVAAELQHSILVEIDDDGGLADLQLSGPAKVLLEEASASDDRVVVEDLEIADALDRIIAAWPSDASPGQGSGPGVASNQQLVRRRILVATDVVLPTIATEELVVDVRRGLSDEEYDDANRASRSTLQAAVGISADAIERPINEVGRTLVHLIRGDAGDLSPRERDALLWLEWADWLGVGIGLVRAGVGSPADGATFVDLVNRCPEVSSTIDKADRDYAEWAFEIAVDLWSDVGGVEGGLLTEVGHQALGPAMIAAWS